MNKADQVARLLLDKIIHSDLTPGKTLGTEAELLEQYQVSRPTLRESLRILESQGVLTLRPGPRGGIIIAKPSVDVLAHTLSVYLRLNSVPFVEILRARLAIEPALVADAAMNGTEAQFNEMEATIDRLEAANDDSEAVYRENRAFHNLIATAANNPVLEVFWSTIRILASGEGAGLKYTERNRQHIVAAHRAILSACRSRDRHTAHRLMIEHLNELEVLLRTRYRDQLEQPTMISFKQGASLIR